MTDTLSNVLSTLSGSSSILSNHPTLTDGGPELYLVPYQVQLKVNETTGKPEQFTSIAHELLFRTQNFNGYYNGIKKEDEIGVTNEHSFKAEEVAKFFGLQDVKGAAQMLGRRYHQDTRVGANDAINCLWQFNRDDDILHEVFTSNSVEGHHIGLSRVYANTTQANQQIAYFTFGVPYYTSLISFHKAAFNEKLIKLTQNGYDSDEGNAALTEIIGEAAGFAISLPVIPFKLFYEIIQRNSYNYQVNRFYELRARMQMYFRYVDTMLAHWLTASGLYGANVPFTKANFTSKPDSLPDALRYTGCNIWEIVSRRAINAGMLDDKVTGNKARIEYVNKSLFGKTSIPQQYGLEKRRRVHYEKGEDLLDAMNRAGDAALDESNADPKNIDEYNRKLSQDKASRRVEKFNTDDNVLAYDDDHGLWQDVFIRSALGATQFIGFRVDKSTDASESFSNSTAPSAYAESYNATVKEISDKEYAFGIKGAASQDTWFDSAVQDIKSLATGVLDGLKVVDFIGVTDLANAAVSGAFLDIPEQYSGSDFNKSHSLSFQLRSPYGDKVSIYQSIIVPLFCILAGALPRAGGASSYVQPFLCRVYCKGMFAIPLGIIDSVSIKRGDSEFGWTYDNIPTCIDVNIGIKDMSPIMYMLMYDEKHIADMFGMDSAFNEYMLTLAGVGLFERISQIQKIIRGMEYTAHTLRNKYFNPLYWTHAVSQNTLVQFVASFIPKIGVGNN